VPNFSKMYLSNLSIWNFKNFIETELEFSDSINCFVGNNGAGKTNLLDAIFFLSFTKSAFNTDSQVLNHDSDFFALHGSYFRSEHIEKIHCGYKNKKKIFKRNQKEYTKVSEHIGFLPLIMISPNDISLILDGSEVRRKFIDHIICQCDAKYLEILLQHNHILKQRNALLKQFFDNTLFEILNEQLIPLATEIFNKRKHFLTNFLPIFQHFYEFISQKNEIVSLSYSSQLQEKDLKTLFSQNFDRDKKLQHTTKGIHRDDFDFKLGKKSLRIVASQGQQKTFLTSLKMAGYEFLKQQHSLKPILLLDDIFDKLDFLRVKKIIELVAYQEFGQIFITDTQVDRIKPFLISLTKNYKIFNIQNGKIIE